MFSVSFRNATIAGLNLVVVVSPVAAGDRVEYAAGYERSHPSPGAPARDLIYCQDRLKNLYDCARTRDFWKGTIDLDRNIGAGIQASRGQVRR